MAYDPALAERIQRAVAGRKGVTEKQMVGGLAFLLAGKTFCGIVKNDLMVRVGPGRYEESLRRRHVRPMDFTGRPLNSYVYVGPDGCRTQRIVEAWVERGVAFVATLDATRAGSSRPGDMISRSKAREAAFARSPRRADRSRRGT